MPIAEIIHEIDSYLEDLTKARKVLAALIKGRRPKLPVVGSESSKAGKEVAASPGKSRDPKGKTRALPQRSKAKKDASSPAGLSGAVADILPHPAHAPSSLQEAGARALVVKVPSPVRRTVRRAQRPSVSKPDAAKPAIALAGPASFKVVVVSPEQARREREQAVRPALVRPAIPTVGGKRAFEALFKNETDDAKTPGQ